MAIRNLTLILLVGAFTSCTPKPYYQVIRVKPDQGLVQSAEGIVYEDENCKITYDLWGAFGNAGFLFFNKSGQIIYLHKEETFFVQNGIANDYYKGRTITNSTSKGISAQRGQNVSTSVAEMNSLGFPQAKSLNVSSKKELINSTGYSISTQEEMLVAIPPQTAKYISEYYANEFIFRDCDLLPYPRRDSSSLSFDPSETPFAFSNLISFQVGKDGTVQTVSNGFHVASITNYPGTAIVRWDYNEFCGKKTPEMVRVFRFSGADMFYLKYYKR